jgi:polysaccharide biosynthesis protein PslE
LKNVDAKSAGSSSIVQLSFRHEDPELAARVVSLLSEMYLERHLGVQRNAETDAFFQEQFAVLQNKLAESQEKIRSFKRLHGLTGSVEEEKNIAIQQRATLGKELNDTRSVQPQVRSRVAELRRQLAGTARTPGKIEQLRENLTTLEIQESSFALRMTAQHPTLLNVRKEIRALQEKLKALEPEHLYGTSTREGLHASLEAELLRNEAEAKALRALESAQALKLAEYQIRLDALERVQPEFIRLQNELEVDEQNYRLYLTKFEESRIARAMDAQKITSVRVIEQARPPNSPIDSKRNSKVVLAIVGSAAAAIALAFVMHLVDRRLDTTDDVERVLDLPVLAAIPEITFRLVTPERVRPSRSGAGIRKGIEAEA